MLPFEKSEYLARIEKTRQSMAKQGIDTRTIQAYVGHRNIMHSALYAAGSEPFPRDMTGRVGTVREHLVTAHGHLDDRYRSSG